ncbi:MAG: phospholipase D-like domain-containing protein [Candidatus Omnitrophica bacterium]|nr:phospholipase D-like domain-containing protein [Candidatus Omnitrophota bacterium]
MLLLAGSVSACPGIETGTISPASNFAPLARAAKDGYKFENDATFLYVTFCASEGLKNNKPISSLRDDFKLPDAVKTKVKFIDIQDGLYIALDREGTSRPRILHYFRNKKRAHTDNAVPIETRSFGIVFAEEISREQYETISEGNDRGHPELLEDAVKYLLLKNGGETTAGEYSRIAEISVEAAYRSLTFLAEMGLVVVNTAGPGAHTYRLRDDLASNSAESGNLLRILNKCRDAGSFKEVEAIAKDAGYVPASIENITETARALFSHEDRCAEELAKQIACAREEIDIAAHRLGPAAVLEALKDRRAGVRLRILLGKDMKKDGICADLEKYGADIKYVRDKDLASDNFIIIDRKTVALGSYSWTEPGSERAEENLIFLRDRNTFGAEFDRRWDGGGQVPAHGRSPPGDIRVYFSGARQCEDAIIEAIKNAKKDKIINPGEKQRIRAALHSFTNKDIAGELFDAKETGIDVQIFLDKGQKRSGIIESYIKALEMKARNREKKTGLVNCRRGRMEITYDHLSGRMARNRFAIINDVTLAGSYDWMRGGKKDKHEDLVLIPGAMREYEKKFDALWRSSYDSVIIDKGAVPLYMPRPPPAENFTDEVYHLFEATRNIRTMRVFDDPDRLYKKSAKFEGRWFADRAYLKSQHDAIRNLNLKDRDGVIYDYALFRGQVEIKKGTVVAGGGINGGSGYQLFACENDIKDPDKIEFLRKTIEEWTGKRWKPRGKDTWWKRCLSFLFR